MPDSVLGLWLLSIDNISLSRESVTNLLAGSMREEAIKSNSHNMIGVDSAISQCCSHLSEVNLYL